MSLAALAASAAVGALVLVIGWARQPVPRWAGSPSWGRRGLPGPPIGLVARWSARGALGVERRAAAVERELVGLRSVLASGATVLAALARSAEEDGAWAEASRSAVDLVALGATLDEALEAWIDRCADPAATLAGQALALAATTGGSHVASIDAALAAVRERAALDREVRALSSQARASAAVLVATPVGFALAVGLFDAGARAVYLGPVGLGCALVGALLDLLGGTWMVALVRRVR